MLCNKLQSIREALTDIQRKVSPENAERLRQCRRNLEAVEELAANLEKNLVFIDWSTEEVTISLPHPQIAISAKEIKVSGILPAKELWRAM